MADNPKRQQGRKPGRKSIPKQR